MLKNLPAPKEGIDYKARAKELQAMLGPLQLKLKEKNLPVIIV